MRTRVVATIACVLAIAGAGAGPARAAFTVTASQAAPADAAAGAHSDFTVALQFAGGDVRDLDISLPPGVLGDPAAAPLCPADAFAAGSCDAATRVGSVSAVVAALGIPLTEPGNVYNLAPGEGELARLGLTLRPLGGLLGRLNTEVGITARAADAGLDSHARGLPATFQGIDIDLQSLSLTLLGKAGAKPFMRNPTSCAPATTRVVATSHADEQATAEASFTPTACEAVEFSPQFDASVGAAGQTGERSHPPLGTVIQQDADEASIRSVRVALPKGVSTDLTRLAGACTEAQATAGTCPESSVIGTVTATTPLLATPLTGPVRLVASAAGALPQVDLELRGALSLRLRGAVDFADGRLVTTFDGIPDVPLSRFALDFTPDGALIANRDLCAGDPLQVDATLRSAGGVERTVQVAPLLTGCPRAPVLKATVGKVRRGRTGVTLRADGRGAALRTVTLTLPKTLTVRKGAKARRSPKSARARVRAHQVVLTLRGAGATTAKLTLPSRSVKVAKRLKAGATVALKARVALADTSRASVRQALDVTLRR